MVLTRVRFTTFVALLPVVSACTDAPTASLPPLPLPLKDRIVFESDRADSLGDVYVMDLEGRDVRRLTDASTKDWCPQISPDGNWIAFYQRRLTGSGVPFDQRPDSLAVMKANGTGIRMFDAVTNAFVCPVWSRDSRLLAVEDVIEWNSVTAGSFRMKTFSIDASKIASFDIQGFQFSNFSPDGSRFVGKSYLFGPYEYADSITTLRLDGGLRRSLAAGVNPSWSPVTNEIIYGCQGLCVVEDVDGAQPRTLGINSGNTYYPGGGDFNSDGSIVALDCGNDSCLANLRDSSITKIGTNGPANPIWADGDRRLVFVCSFHQEFIGDICIVGRDGSALTILTKDYPFANDVHPSVSR